MFVITFYLLLLYLLFNSFSIYTCIYINFFLFQFFIFCWSFPLFLSHSFPLSLSLYSFFRPSQHDRPSFSLTLGISLPRLFIAILLSSSIQSGGLPTLSLPFFPSLRSYPYLPAIICFHWPSVPRRSNSGERLPYLHVWG